MQLGLEWITINLQLHYSDKCHSSQRFKTVWSLTLDSIWRVRTLLQLLWSLSSLSVSLDAIWSGMNARIYSCLNWTELCYFWASPFLWIFCSLPSQYQSQRTSCCVVKRNSAIPESGDGTSKIVLNDWCVLSKRIDAKAQFNVEPIACGRS